MIPLRRAAGSRLRGLALILVPVGLFVVVPRDVPCDVSASGGNAVERPEVTFPPSTSYTTAHACQGYEVSHPLSVRLEPSGVPTPGAALTVRVEVTSRRLVDDSEISVRPPDEVTVLSGRSTRLGLLRADTPTASAFTLLLPPDEVRRTVDVIVRGHVDGAPMTRGATLNLNFREEPSRTVIGSDGRLVREVRARRIGR
jgi:hypothetical protein